VRDIPRQPPNPQSESILPTTGTAGLSLPRHGPSESSLMTEHRVHCWMAEELTGRRRGTSFAKSFVRCPATTADHYDVDYITIDIFPDELLPEIFAFCMCGRGNEDIWQTLVHVPVCWRWRSIVFGSPLSLNLRIVCTDKTYEALDIWPAFPIIIRIANLNTDLGDMTAFPAP
jgi:hypothetical protein